MTGRCTVQPTLHHRVAPPKLQQPVQASSAPAPVQTNQTQPEGGALSKAISNKLQALNVKPKRKMENIRFSI
jgi:hypothetical protein